VLFKYLFEFSERKYDKKYLQAIGFSSQVIPTLSEVLVGEKKYQNIWVFLQF
jgi:hypothetical protein